MYHQISLEGALNWAMKPNNSIVMLVPNKHAIKDTMMRLNKKYNEIDPRYKVFIRTNRESEMVFDNGSSIRVMIDTHKNSFRGLSIDVLYVHPWCNYFYSPDSIIQTCLSKGAVVLN